MTISNKLTMVFIFFYVSVIIYLILFITIPDFKNIIIESRQNIASLTQGNNYFLALAFSFFICLIGNASVGFPVPYPFIIFSLSDSIFIRYSVMGFSFGEILFNMGFWVEISGIALIGGFGSALGELVSFLIGRGARKIASTKNSPTLANVQGFGKLVLQYPKALYFFIFIAAALPIPDDPLWIALGMSKKKINFTGCLFWAWMGKNITMLFYVTLPILILLGFNASGIEFNDISSVITEAIMLLITISIMYFIMGFNWNKYIEKHQKHNNKMIE
ncbi:MAG: hypothetical protein EAX89_12360 [Candidatus Lokiarchaeota archaeon]|nr:hypothetical protein [Candidatus Lokiarchaeota archaeon]